MSAIQCANILFESTANNRLQYTGSNTFALVAAGSNSMVVNSSLVSYTVNVTFSSSNVIFNSSNVSFNSNVSISNLSVNRITANSSTGTAGQLLTSGASGNVYWTNNIFTQLGGSSISNTQTFNASGTWTKPASGTYAVVRLWGGGGGAVWSACVGYGGAGGGGGAFHECFFLLSDLTATVSVTIGGGGTGYYGGGGTIGGDGGTTTFGSYLSAYGGLGGAFYNSCSGGGFYRGEGAGSGANLLQSANKVNGVLPVTGTGFQDNATIGSINGFLPMISNARNGTSNDGLYGGGNGGQDTASGSPAGRTVGSSRFGGGGGAGNGSGNGTSVYGGNGGLTGNGTQPGGGGAAYNVGAYNGAAGRCIVYVL